MGLGPHSADLDALQGADLSYPEHGATRGDLPPGYRHVHRRGPVGTGRATFDRAVRRLLSWDMHRQAGLRVTTTAPTATTNAVVVLAISLRWRLLTAPCRVVYTVDQPSRRGFAYGTLPGHPERGEEAFILELDPTDQVWIDIRVFSRPAWRLARAAGPLNRIAQDFITNRYLNALRT